LVSLYEGTGQDEIWRLSPLVQRRSRDANKELWAGGFTWKPT